MQKGDQDPVSLTDAIGRGPQASNANFEVVYIDGAVGPDTDPVYFRIYPDASALGSYLLLRRDDQVGELLRPHEPSDGGDGQVRYRIPVKLGAVAHRVSVSTFRIGESPAGGPGPAADDCICNRTAVDVSSGCTNTFNNCAQGKQPICESTANGGCRCRCSF